MELALLILGMAVVTFATRYIMIALLGRYQVPATVKRALYYVPIAAFSAIILPELVTRAGQLALAPDNPRLLGGAAAIAVAALTRRMLLTIAVGMGVMWLAQWMLVR